MADEDEGQEEVRRLTPAVKEPYIWMILRAAVRFMWILADNVISIVTYCVTLFLFYPLRLIAPKFYWETEAFLFRELMRNVGYWMWSAKYKIVEYGDLPFRYQNDRCLVVVNHQSTADVPTLCAAICKKGVGSGKMMWILDKMFRFTNFGVVSWMHGDFFIQQGRDTRHQQGPKLAQHMESYFWTRDRRWFVVFPEGGFLHKRRHTSQEYARLNGYPVLQNVTLPRVGAVKAMLDTAKTAETKALTDSNMREEDIRVPLRGFRYLIDVTLAYPDGEPLDLMQLIFASRPACEVGVYYRLFRIDDVPNDEEKLTRFLYGIWEEKDRLLEHYNKNGHFPGVPREDGNIVDYHLAGLILHNGLFLLLGFIYVYIVRVLLSYFVLVFQRLF